MISEPLRLWVLPSDGYRTLETVDKALEPWRREHPQAPVEVTVRTASSLWRHLIRMLKRPGEPPYGQPVAHLVEIPSHWTATLAALGLLEDVSRAAAPGLAGTVRALRPHCASPGGAGVFSLACTMEIWVLFCREDVFSGGRARLSELSEWDGLAESCRRLARRMRNKGGFVIANHNPREAVSLADVAGAVWSRGGDFFSSDGTRCVFHREEAFRGMRSYLQLLANGWMPLLGRSGLVPEDLFDGRCALQFSGRFRRDAASPPRARRAGRFGRRLAVLPLPGGEAGRSGVVTAHSVAMLRNADHPEALGLLRYLAGPGAAAYAEALGAFPCVEDWAGDRFEGAGEIEAVFRSAFASARALPALPVTATLERIFDRGMEKLIRSILRGSYREDALRQELLFAAAEMDYILELAR